MWRWRFFSGCRICAACHVDGCVSQRERIITELCRLQCRVERESRERERDAYFPDMVGFGANRRGGRLPSLFFIFMMVVIAILSFNYWTVSNRQSSLLDELVEAQTQVKRTDAARSRLEKRNSELIVQVDTHRKQIDQKDGDYSLLEGKLQAQQADFRKCSDEKVRRNSAELPVECCHCQVIAVMLVGQ